ncbi:hypothetical protein TNCV_1432061 [Trichonephila clavipes]|nr:hypothetical protein TNCV_1432061 [Trichonephila clavipes]
MQVIRRLDTGERQSQIGVALNLATSTIRSSVTATRITRSRNNTKEEMEKRLFIWIDVESERKMPLSQSTFLIK